MKKINELNRAEKLMVLSALQSGEIHRAELTSDCFFQSDTAELFNTLIELETKKKQGSDMKILFIGEAARIVKSTYMPIIAYKIVNEIC